MRVVRSLLTATVLPALFALGASVTAVHASTVDIGTAQGAAGAVVPIDVSLNGTSAKAIVAVTNQIGFDAASPIAAGGDGKPDCTLNPAITKPNTAFSFQPRSCTVGTTCTSVKAAVISLDPASANTPIANGTLYTCRFAIPGTAAAGAMFNLANVKATVTDVDHADFDVTAQSAAGSVTVAGPTGPTVDIGSAQGPANTTVDLAISLNGTSPKAIVAVTNQIGFDAASPIAAGGDGKPDCTLNPAIVKPNTAFSFQPRSCTVGTTCTSVKAAVISLDPASANTPIANGTLYTCHFAIPQGAADGTIFTLTNVKATVTDVDHADFDVTADSQGGKVTVGEVGTPTITPTIGEGTPTITPTTTATPTQTIVPPSNTPTNTPTQTVVVVPPTATSTATRTVTASPSRTATPTTGAPTPAPFSDDDGGCNIGTQHTSNSTWLLLIPAVGLLVMKRRRR